MGAPSIRGDRLTLELVALGPLPEVQPDDDLGALLAGAAPRDLTDGDVLVVAHKVVSKSEGRLRRLSDTEPEGRAREIAAEQEKDPRLVQVVLDESAEVLRTERGVIVCVTRHGFVCANAGVDASNAPDGHVILLPLDPDSSARALRARIGELRGVRPAVVVTDSFGRAWRNGQTDVAIGAAASSRSTTGGGARMPAGASSGRPRSRSQIRSQRPPIWPGARTPASPPCWCAASTGS